MTGPPPPTGQPTVTYGELRCALVDALLDSTGEQALDGLDALTHRVAGVVERRGITVDYRPAAELPTALPEQEALGRTEGDLWAIMLRLTSLGRMLSEQQRPGADRCLRARQLVEQTRKIIGALRRQLITDQLLALTGPTATGETTSATGVPGEWLILTGAPDTSSLLPVLEEVRRRGIALSDDAAVLEVWRELTRNGEPST